MFVDRVHQDGPAVHASRCVRIVTTSDEVSNSIRLSRACRPHKCGRDIARGTFCKQAIHFCQISTRRRNR